MEPRFRHDFSRVRVHADTQAAESARAVNALAFTVGNDVVFGNGQYAPQTPAGRRLLAHELAHTIQQSRSGATPLHAGSLRLSRREDPAEREANAAAGQVSQGSHNPIAGLAPPTLTHVPGAGLQRQPDGEKSESAEKKLTRTAREAAARATQKVEQEGLAKLRDHVPRAPEPRRVPDARKSAEPLPHAPPVDLRPDPFEVEPERPKPAAQDDPVPGKPELKPDPGSAEHQLAVGGVLQSGPGQGGGAVQAAFQDKNIVPGRIWPFLNYFTLQLGVLQPTLTLQVAHIAPFKRGTPSAANPLPPPDTAQFSATFSPAVVKVGKNFSIAPQIGVAGAVAGDVFAATKGPGKSGEHVQALGVINLQLDYKFTDLVSATGSIGYQEGVDSGPQGNQETHAVTGSLFVTFHIGGN